MNEENKPETKTEGEPIKKIQTYEDAVKEALQKQSMSSASMLMAEQKKRESFKNEDYSESIKNPKNFLFLILSIILVVLAFGVLIFSLISDNKNLSNEDPKSILKSKYFETEQSVEVSSAQLSRNTLNKIQQAFNEPYEINDVVNIVITKEVKADPTSVFDFKKKVPYNTLDLLSLIEARAPELVRNYLDEEFVLGVHKSSKNEPFLIIKTTNFENVFAGMFEWEFVLAKDMSNIFVKEIASVKKTPERILLPTNASTSTSTTDLISAPQRTIDNTRVWKDRVINNIDARVLLGENDEVVFFYAFIDNEYLFFGTKEETLNEIIRRVRNAKLVI